MIEGEGEKAEAVVRFPSVGEKRVSVVVGAARKGRHLTLPADAGVWHRISCERAAASVSAGQPHPEGGSRVEARSTRSRTEVDLECGRS